MRSCFYIGSSPLGWLGLVGGLVLSLKGGDGWMVENDKLFMLGRLKAHSLCL